MNIIDVKTLTEYEVSKHFSNFEQEHFERCPECGSSLFRIYKEPVEVGTYEQFICAICNHRYGGWLNDWKKLLETKPKKKETMRKNKYGK